MQECDRAIRNNICHFKKRKQKKLSHLKLSPHHLGAHGQVQVVQQFLDFSKSQSSVFVLVKSFERIFQPRSTTLKKMKVFQWKKQLM